MGILVLILTGGLLGWLASIVMRTDAQQGILLNIVVGVAGALIAGFLINPMIGGGNILAGDYSASSIIVSFAGSIVLLAVVNLVRRRALR